MKHSMTITGDAKMVAMGQKIELAILGPRICSVWSRETASPSCQERWSEEVPALGQCAVTALLLQDLIGGEIVRTEVPGFGSYYYNRMLFGNVDLTKDQFPAGTAIPHGVVVDAAQVLDSESAKTAKTRERFELLKERFYRSVVCELIGLKAEEVVCQLLTNRSGFDRLVNPTGGGQT